MSTADIDHGLRVLRVRWWWVIAVALLGAAAAFWGARQAEPLYRAMALLLVPNPNPPSLYLATIRAPEMARQVQEDLDLPAGEYSEDVLVSKLAITETGKKGLFEVSYTDPDPSRAATIVNAWVTLFAESQAAALIPSRSEAARQLKQAAFERWLEEEQRLAELEGSEQASSARIRAQAARIEYEAYTQELARLEMEQVYEVGRVFVAARSPERGSPVRTSPLRQAFLGGAFGLAAGLLLAFGIDALRRTSASLGTTRG